jgi:hypothetical protein
MRLSRLVRAFACTAAILGMVACGSDPSNDDTSLIGSEEAAGTSNMAGSSITASMSMGAGGVPGSAGAGNLDASGMSGGLAVGGAGGGKSGNAGGAGGAPAGNGGSGGGHAGNAGAGGASSTPLPADPCVAKKTCPDGVWVNVTPSNLAPLDFGPGPIVTDPLRPSDLYMGGGGDGLWKSTDYGNTWSKINSTIGYVASGVGIAVLPATPAIVIATAFKAVRKSIDGGITFRDIKFDFPDVLYSIEIDPYDSNHLLSGLHETGGIVESTDGGESWAYVKTGNFPNGGSSWYAFFVDTGDAATTRNTWLAIPQAGASTTMTSNGGQSWTIPTGLDGLQHAHGNAQIFQKGDTIWVPGTNGPGNGMYRSTDRGKTFTRILDGTLAVAWGTAKNVYAMWGWACSKCDLGANFSVAPLPDGTKFTKPAVPAALNIGPRNIAVTSDGNHNVFVGTMWSSGVWRYVEP